MKSNERNVKKILELLLKSPHFLTMEFLSRNVGVSKRSVQNYLLSIERWLAESNFKQTQIIKKQGLGVAIEISAGDRMKMQRLLGYDSLSIHSGDNKRRLLIIKKLIILQEDVTIQSLADEFFVSRSVIILDLEWVEQWLAQYKLKLFKTQRRGIGVIGDEMAHRNAIVRYLEAGEAEDVKNPISSKKHARLPENSYINLTQVYSQEAVEKVAEIIELVEDKFDFFLTSDYYASLITHLVISISRLKSGKIVPEEFMPPEEDFPELETQTATFIAQQLEQSFSVKVSDMEKVYICIHLVGFNAFSPKQPEKVEMPEKIQLLACRLIESIDAQLGTKFINDKLLLFGLGLHLKSEIYRLQNGVYYNRASEIKRNENYIDIYNAAKAASGLYTELCGVQPDEEEILNLSFYFLLSLHRNLRKVKAIIVCNSGNRA